MLRMNLKKMSKLTQQPAEGHTGLLMLFFFLTVLTMTSLKLTTIFHKTDIRKQIRFKINKYMSVINVIKKYLQFKLKFKTECRT